MNFDFLKGSAIIGIVIGFWDKIKQFLWRIVSVVIERVDISTEEAHDALIGYLIKNYTKYSTYDKNFGATNEWLRNGKYGLVPFERFGTSSIIFRDNKRPDMVFRWPFIFSDKKENMGSQEGNVQNHSESTNKVYSTITCIRGKLNIDEIIRSASELRNDLSWQSEIQDEDSNRFDIFYLPDKDNHNHAYFSKASSGFAWYKQSQYRLLGIMSEDIGRSTSASGKAIDNLYFPNEVKDLINIISLWVKSKNWYNNEGIPWKRGWLLYGPPGTGKTALVRAFAEDLNLPIYVFSLSQMSNNDLTSSWKNMQLNIPCIALIEDIDNVFHGRKNIASRGNFFNMSSLSSNNSGEGNDDNSTFTPLTFDCLLNCLDGVDKSEGVFTIITTNDPTKIDEAIGKPVLDSSGSVVNFVSSRPGRIDKAIELTYMSKENKKAMAKKLLGDYPDQLEGILNYIETDIKETPAQFQEYCSQIAIQEYWKEITKVNSSVKSDLKE